jgi:fibro-slime domain-containing protein
MVLVKRVLTAALCVTMLCGDLTTITAMGVNEAGVTETATETETAAESQAQDATDAGDVIEIGTEAATEESAEAKIEENTEETTEAGVKTYAAEDEEQMISLEATAADGVTVTLEGEASSFPSGTEYALQVTAVETEEVAQAVENSEVEIAEYVAYDIDLYVDGELSEPTGNVNVTFSGNLPVTAGQEENIAVYHVDGNELVEVEETTADAQEQTVEMVTDHFSVYLIGLKGTAKNIFSVVQNNDYLQIVSVNDADKKDSAKNDITSYVYNENDIKANPDKYYLWVQVFYNNNRVATAPNNSTATDYPYAFLQYAESGQTFEIKTTEDYQVSDVELKYNYNWGIITSGDVTKNAEKKDSYSVSLKPSDGNGDGVGDTFCCLNIYLTDADTEIETENFLVDLFQYDTNTVNAASQKIDSSEYLEFNGGDGIKEWNQNHFNGVYQGLAEATLTDELIQFNKAVTGIFSKSETTTFDTKNMGNGVTSYYNVTFPFRKLGDYYVYDSNTTSATFDKGAGTISLGDANSGFWPFGVNNYHFGMNFETEFYMTADGTYNGEDCVFEFSGDDDVWVYVDDELVLDLGGIHPAVGGSINFATGDVEFYTVGATGAINTKADYIDDSTIVSTDAGIQYASYNLYDAADKGLNKLTKDAVLSGTAHTLQVYYLERGEGSSNCKIKFNLPQTPQQNTLVVTNTVENAEDDADDTAFTYTIKKNGESVGNVSYIYKKQDGSTSTEQTDAAGAFTLKDGEKAVFAQPEDGKYTVAESLITGYEATYVAQKTGNILGQGEATDADDSSDLTASLTVVTEMNTSGDLYEIHFTNVKTVIQEALEYSKTTTLYDLSGADDLDAAWDARTYRIEIDASSLTTEVENQTSVGVADVMLVLDRSGSMGEESTTTLGRYCDVKDSLDREKTYTLKKHEWLRDREYSLRYNSQKGYWEYYADHVLWKSWDKVDDSETGTVTYTQSELSTMQDAAVSFVNNMAEASPDSKVGLASYAASNEDNGTLDYALQTVTSTPSEELYSAIQGLTANGGTSPKLGLSIALEQLEAAEQSGDNNQKYIILFTDGEPTGNGSQWDQTEADEALALANAIKEKGYIIYTVGLTSTDQAKQWLESIASSPEQAYTINDIAELSAIFAEISTKVTKNTAIPNAAITDVIDARFELAEGEKARLTESGAAVTYNEDGTTTVTWSNQDILPKNGDEPGNQYYINIVAKDDFIGGNNIPTNAAGSKITALDQTYDLPYPLVNVKENLVVSDQEETIFLGETVPFDSDIIAQMFAAYENSAYTLTWYEDKGLTTVVDAAAIKENKPSLDGATYYLTVTAQTVEPSDESLLNTAGRYAGDADNGYVITAVNENDSTQKYGVYTVKVIAGTITITKTIAAEDYSARQGDPIFTFRITNEESGKTFYKTVRFGESECTGGNVSHTVQLTGLEKGIYAVEELHTLRYDVAELCVDTANTTCAYEADEQANTISFAIGCSTLGNNAAAEDANLQYGSVTYRNTKVNDDKMTDTDVSKNSLVIGQKISKTPDADNEAAGSN